MRSVWRQLILVGGLAVALLSAGGGVGPVAAHEATAEPVIHEVAWGENLYRIAQRYGVSVDAIVAANGLSSPDQVYVGQRLIIPSGGGAVVPAAAASTHVVQPGENLFRIGLQYGLTTDVLAQANGLASGATLYAGQVLQIPAGGAVGATATSGAPTVGQHTVLRGETLEVIARRYGVGVDAIAAANALYNPGQIYAGQVLVIPGGAGTPDVGYAPAQVAQTHVVARGETLTAIARQYGVSQGALMQVNNIANPSLLYAGQTLTIPAGAALSTGGVGGASGKRIVVDLSDQRTYVYQDGALLWTFVVSTGLPGQATWTGTFHVQNKLPNAYAANWDLQMPYWLGIYWAGSLQNGFHALPILSNGQRLWADVLGRPASYGCIILGVDDARRLYEWAEIGTEVSIVP